MTTDIFIVGSPSDMNRYVYENGRGEAVVGQIVTTLRTDDPKIIELAVMGSDDYKQVVYVRWEPKSIIPRGSYFVFREHDGFTEIISREEFNAVFC